MPTTHSYDRGYGPSIEEFQEVTNRTVTNSDEFYRQRARAQEVFDSVAGPWPKFHLPEEREITLTSVTNSGITSSDLNESKDGFYNNMEMRVIQGDGRGFRGFIDDYNSTTGFVSVSGVSGDISQVNTDSQVLLKQIAQFPREQDFDVTVRPRVPEPLPRIIAYIMEYWINLESQEGWNADELANQQTDIIQESLGDWQTTYKSDRDILRQFIGPKAFELGTRYGFFRRTARLMKFRTKNFGDSLRRFF